MVRGLMVDEEEKAHCSSAWTHAMKDQTAVGLVVLRRCLGLESSNYAKLQ